MAETTYRAKRGISYGDVRLEQGDIADVPDSIAKDLLRRGALERVKRVEQSGQPEIVQEPEIAGQPPVEVPSGTPRTPKEG